MKPNAIKAQFTKHIKESMGSKNPRLDNWYVGITNDTKRRKAQHKNKKGVIKYWKSIDAVNLEDANEVEKYFSEKGTINLPTKNGAKASSKFAYIFKLPNKKYTGLNGVHLENVYDLVFGE